MGFGGGHGAAPAGLNWCLCVVGGGGQAEGGGRVMFSLPGLHRKIPDHLAVTAQITQLWFHMQLGKHIGVKDTAAAFAGF